MSEILGFSRVRGELAVEGEPVGGEGVGEVVDFMGVAVGVAIPGVVPAGAHIGVKGFGVSGFQEAVEEVAEFNVAVGIGNGEPVADKAEGTEFIGVAITSIMGHNLAFVDKHLLLEPASFALITDTVKSFPVVFIKDSGRLAVPYESSGATFAYGSVVEFPSGYVAPDDIAVSEFVEKLCRESPRYHHDYIGVFL